MRGLLFPLIGLLTACASLPEPPPAQTYAWVTFDRTGITASAASGFADRRTDRALTIDDPVRIASVSKLVVALAVMKLVEQGRLDLGRDVSDYLGWRLRSPAFPEQPITLRHLLSHRSSLTDRVDYAVPLGTDLASVMAQERAFDRDHAPGSYFRYANLNFPVIASVMERVSGERFDHLMERLVLDPLGLDACFNWTTCSDAAIARAVVLYQLDGIVIRDDLRGRRPACPVLAPTAASCDLNNYRLGSNGALFSPQGGLRISARDLATIGQLLLNKGRHGDRQFISEARFETMATHYSWRLYRLDAQANGDTDNGFYCAYGLGVQHLPGGQQGCRDDLFGDGRAAIGHAGEAYGVRSGLWIDPASGRGIAFFATGLGDSLTRGRSAYTAIEEWLAGHIN